MSYRDATRLREVIEASIGQPDGTEHGEVNYPCPLCRKRGYASQSHLHVNYQKDRCICHQCGGFRSLTSLVRVLYGKVPKSLIELKFDNGVGEAVRKTINRAFSPAQTDAKKVHEPVKLPDEFIPLSNKPGDTMGQIALDYLTIERAVPYRFLEEIGVGYCKEGRFRGYAIFPVHVGGRLVTFTSRAVCSTGAKAQHAPNSESHLAIFNYDTAADMNAKRVFVAEGPISAWAFHHKADENDAGVAILGKVLHDDQARLLDMLPCEELIMCLDDTEHAKTIEFAGKLANKTSKRVSYILLKEGTGDPDDNRDKIPWYVKRRKPYSMITSRLEGLRRFA